MRSPSRYRVCTRPHARVCSWRLPVCPLVSLQSLPVVLLCIESLHLGNDNLEPINPPRALLMNLFRRRSKFLEEIFAVGARPHSNLGSFVSRKPTFGDRQPTENTPLTTKLWKGFSVLPYECVKLAESSSVGFSSECLMPRSVNSSPLWHTQWKVE